MAARPNTPKVMPAPPMVMNSSGISTNHRSAVSPRSITASSGLAGLTQHSVRLPGLSRATIAALPRYPLVDQFMNWYRPPTKPRSSTK